MQEGQQPNEPGWVFRPGDQSAVPTPPPAPIATQEAPSSPKTPTLQQNDENITWTASEYIANPKSAGWFSVLAIGCAVLAAISYIVTKDVVSTVVTVVLGVIIGVFAARQPRTLQYVVDSNGLKIGEKFYPYADFKSFSVAQEHAIAYISLLPLKRFMPPLIIHYAPDDEQRIAETLADYLPYEEHKADVVDSIARRIRF